MNHNHDKEKEQGCQGHAGTHRGDALCRDEDHGLSAEAGGVDTGAQRSVSRLITGDLRPEVDNEGDACQKSLPGWLPGGVKGLSPDPILLTFQLSESGKRPKPGILNCPIIA